MDDLLARAHAARDRAICPYSDFPVGAALRTADGTVLEGANLEVANYSNSLHAEEVAVARALMAGHRIFEAVAVAGPDADGLTPCGMCRQTLAEFADDDLRVVVDDDGTAHGYTLGELLPASLRGDSLLDR